MHAFDVLGDPVRRRILELLAEEDQPAGQIVEVIHREFGLSQAGVSQHLKVLRESGFANVQIDGARRIYALQSAPLHDATEWLNQFRPFWKKHLNALGAELAKKPRR